MPQDPAQDPTQDQSFTGLDQQAVSAALDTYNQAASMYTNAGQQYDVATQAQAALAGDPTADAQALAAANSKLQTASAQLDNARTQLGSASRSYSDLTGKLAVAYQAQQRKATDPARQQLWDNEAQKAQSQSDLYRSEADMYQAKTQAQLDTASQNAQAALSRAQSVASRVPAQNEASQAQAALANARAAQLPALTASTVALHQGQIQLAGARSQQAVANANRAQAQADYISGPQTDDMVARGELTKAQADQIKQLGGAKLSDLVAKGVLEQSRAAQIQANTGKWNVLPYADANNPTLTQQQASTGQIAGVPNPGYKNPYLQPLQDRAAAIDAIKNELAAGKFGTGQAAIDYANRLVDGISQASLAQAQGYTPQQYEQTVQSQAAAGQQALSGIQSQGNSMANTLLQAAGKVRGLEGQSFTPYQNAIGMAGGTPALQQAFSLAQQLKPIQSRADLLPHIQAWAAVKQAASQGDAAPPSAPTGQATQDDGSPVAANMAAQAQSLPPPTVQGPNTGGYPVPADQANPAGNPLSMALLQAALRGGM